MRNARIVFALLAFMLCGCAVRPPAARAQFIGFTSPQTVQQTLAPAGTGCTGIAQNFNVSNLGQTQHFASIVLSNANTLLSMKIQGLDNTGNIFTISDVAFGAGTSGANQSITAAGYFPIVRVSVTCSGGTFTLTYSGSSSTVPVNSGVFLSSAIDKVIFAGTPESASVTGQLFVPPYGSTSGTVTFQYVTAAIASSTLTVSCVANGVNTVRWSDVFTLANTTALQTFPVGPTICGLIRVDYTTGGGGAGNASMDYLFSPPGTQNSTLGAYSHITGTTATSVKTGAASLMGIALNTSAAGTISVFDLASAACTGTPSTQVVAVLTIGATEIARQIPYNIQMTNGVCVKASAAMDFTVEYQ